jgi:hypothetical protein
VLLICIPAQAMTKSCLDDRHLQKPQGWWVSQFRALPNVNIDSMLPRFWNRSGFRRKTISTLRRRSSSFIQGDGDRTPSWDLQEHWHRNFPPFKTYTIPILETLLFGGFSHGFSPSGLSHEDPLIKQLARPCLFSFFYFLNRPVTIVFHKFNL